VDERLARDSMPVSRSRLLAVKALVGFLETTSIVAFMLVCTWTLFPLIRGNSTPADLVKLLRASVTCVLCFYFVSLTIATVGMRSGRSMAASFLQVSAGGQAGRFQFPLPPTFSASRQMHLLW
jgi:hypothetical protein